jgi:predicted 3-demethylubiquinone-9 3-methyltransferase (glyoxalase superfamily)
MAKLQMITPCLWFDDQAQQAAKFYTSIFDNSRILRTLYYTDAGHETHGQPAGSVMTVEFELDGQRFTTLNGGPAFSFSEAISLEIQCQTQDEIDYYWEKLCDGGQEGPCGWLKDRFGLSWQVTPLVLGEMLSDPDEDKRRRVMEAFLQMKKLDLAAIEQAFNGSDQA